MLTEWKKTAGHEWLADAPATVLTQTLRDQDQAFRNFFGVKKDGSKRKSKTRYPKPRKRRTRASLRFQDIGKAWQRGELSLPKLGALKLAEELRWHRGGIIKRSGTTCPHPSISFSQTCSRIVLNRDG